MRMLVAEDDAVSRTMLVRILGAMGHQVHATQDGEEAWAAFRRETFDVVVTDWLMPRLDGLELTQRIRGLRTGSYPWIIMLTGMDFAENYRRTMEAGVDDFLTKPLDAELLRVRLTVAQRVQRMNEHVAALTAALPICMHCKNVRDSGDRWRRVEEFFHDIDFSHSYCPECYYEHSLVPELSRMRDGHAPTDGDAALVLDRSVLAALAKFEEADSPGLVEDLVGSFTESAGPLAQAVRTFGDTGIVDEDCRRRLLRFATRCHDLGLGRLAAALEGFVKLGPDEQLARHREVAAATVAEFEAALAALAEFGPAPVARPAADVAQPS